MRKPFTIAMAISVAIHGGLFLALALLWDREAEPGATDTLLILNLETGDTDYRRDEVSERASSPSEEAAVSAAIPGGGREDPAQAGRPVHAPEPSNRVLAEPPASASETLMAALPAMPATAMTEIADRIGIEPTVGARLLTTTSPAGQRVASGYAEHGRVSTEFVSIPGDEERMLRRRLRALGEDLLRDGGQPQTMRWEHEGREYTARLRLRPADENTGLDEMLVEVVTDDDGRQLRTELRMKRLAFSNFAQFVHWWDPDVQIHNDALDGRFHSNSRITLAGDRRVKPLFLGKVTTSSRGIRVGERRGRLSREDIFLGGLETGVRKIRMPEQFLLFPEVEKSEQATAHHFTTDARVSFVGDGSFRWRPSDSEEPARRVDRGDDPLYLVAEDGVELQLQGVVSGKVLVYSPERIVITGDLVYARGPRQSESEGDYLGLVSDGIVEVAGRHVTGPGDIEIHASIYAGRRFAVRGYNIRGNDLLYIFGSLTAGSITATEPRFSTRIEFDRRLESVRPPGFPVTDRFEVASWDGSWRVDEES